MHLILWQKKILNYVCVLTYLQCVNLLTNLYREFEDFANPIVSSLFSLGFLFAIPKPDNSLLCIAQTISKSVLLLALANITWEYSTEDNSNNHKILRASSLQVWVDLTLCPFCVPLYDP